MSDDSPPDAPPDLAPLEPAFSDQSTEERVYSVLVQSTEVLRVSDVVEELGCSKDTARKYLDWFAELGIAVKHDGRPVQYERNEEYFEWRYVSHLVDTHSLEEIKENVIEMRDLLETFRSRYDAEHPSGVDLREATAARDAPLEEVWDDFTTWAGLESEIRLHDRARQRFSDRDESSWVSAD